MNFITISKYLISLLIQKKNCLPSSFPPRPEIKKIALTQKSPPVFTPR
jgi:hypothetical protein